MAMQINVVNVVNCIDFIKSTSLIGSSAECITHGTSAMYTDVTLGASFDNIAVK